MRALPTTRLLAVELAHRREGAAAVAYECAWRAGELERTADELRETHDVRRLEARAAYERYMFAAILQAA